MKHLHSLGNIAAALLLAGGILSSCSQDELAQGNGTPLPNGKFPLQLSASVAEAVPTRTAGKDGWIGNEEIAVSTDETTYKYRITDATGTTEFADDTQEPFYWQNTTQTANIMAWYPFADQTGIDITRQDLMNNLSEIDFLKADPVENANYQTEIALTFRHQMAKVSYKLIPGGGITDADLKSAAVSIAGYTRVSFSGGTLTSTEEIGWITPTSDGDALLVPQNMTGKPFVKVSISGNEYIYTPGSGAADLQSGTRHTYAITVRKNGIEVSSVSASWNDDTTTGTGGEPVFWVYLPKGHRQTLTYSKNATLQDDGHLEVKGNSFSIFYNVTDIDRMKGFSITDGTGKIERTVSGDVYTFTYTLHSDVLLTYDDYIQAGDYYYSDGTWDPDYDSGKTCIGIVFKGGAGEGDAASNYDGKLTNIQGYVVALTDAHNQAGAWGVGNRVESQLPSEASYTPKYNGYANTKAIQKVAEYASTDVNQPTADKQYWAFKVASEYSGTLPLNSSGWYLPSVGQLADIYNLPDRADRFAKAGGTDFISGTNDGRYWSSTQKSYYDAWYYQFNGDGAHAYGKIGGFLNPSYVRTVLTF